MQVSSTSDLNVFDDPFGDGASTTERTARQQDELKSDLEAEPAASEPPLPEEPPASELPAMPDEPSATEDTLPPDNEPLPTPPERERPSYEQPLPARPNPEAAGDLSEGISTPSALVGCQGYKADCDRAIADLQSRGITKVYIGLAIEGTEGDAYPCECKLGREYSQKFTGRQFSRTVFTWKATGICHKPLYFEDVQLERYGHSWNPVVQPFMSAGHFFLSVPLLPYKMGLTPPTECIYTLGYYRPGSCSSLRDRADPVQPPRAALFEAAGLTGLGFWLWQ